MPSTSTGYWPTKDSSVEQPWVLTQAYITEGLEGAAASAKARRRLGSARVMSTIRMTTASSQPRNQMHMQGRLTAPGTPTQTVIVIGSHVVGESIASTLKQSCRQLAVLAQTPLLGIDFVKDQQGHWLFAGATPLPDLVQGGEATLDALAVALQSGQEVT